MFACLLLCFISMFTCLNLGLAMLYALCGFKFVSIWGHLLAWLHPPLLWLVGCDHLWNTSPWCWCAWYTPFSTSCNVVMLALLALCHPFSFLCFFASLHTCLHVHVWVCVSSILQSHGTMDARSKPTFFLLGHLLCLIICLFASVWILLLFALPPWSS